MQQAMISNTGTNIDSLKTAHTANLQICYSTVPLSLYGCNVAVNSTSMHAQEKVLSSSAMHDNAALYVCLHGYN